MKKLAIIDTRIRRENENGRRKAALPYEPPVALLHASLDNYHSYTDSQRNALQSVSEFIDHVDANLVAGCGGMLWGSNGSGKSHLMKCVGDGAYAAGFHVVHMDSSYLITKLRSIAKQISGMVEADFVRMLARVDLLLLDDIGKEQEWEGDLSRLSGLLSQRYNNQKATWLTSEMEPGELARHLGRYADGVLSRLLGKKNRLIRVEGPDYRVRGGK